jgi:hypothetical protein
VGKRKAEPRAEGARNDLRTISVRALRLLLSH